MEEFKRSLFAAQRNRQDRLDAVLPSLESDWSMGEFDFEAHLRKIDQEKDAEIDRFHAQNPEFRKSNVVCTKWLQGLCCYIDYKCPQLHVYNPDLFPICRFFIKEKSCTNPACIFRHPGRDEEVICIEYARGFCKDGPKCDFTHRKYDEDEMGNIRYHVDEALNSHREARRRAELLINDNPKVTQ